MCCYYFVCIPLTTKWQAFKMVTISGAGFESFEHLFPPESTHSPLTQQTVDSLKPPITTNSQQMFLLYSGVKTLHQKQSQLLLMQTQYLSVKFFSSFILFNTANSLFRYRKDKITNIHELKKVHIYIFQSVVTSCLCLFTSLLKTLN